MYFYTRANEILLIKLKMRHFNLLISEHKIFEGKPPSTPSKGRWNKIDVSTIASAKMAMQAKVKRTSSSDKLKNTTINNPLYVKVNKFGLNLIIVARTKLRDFLERVGKQSNTETQ